MSLARTERAALADLLIRVGPEQPTLCEGWRTGELLNHLIIRERHPLAALGGALSPLATFTERQQRRLDRQPFADRIGLLRSGPPAWNPLGWGKLDQLANGAEMFIHHEDARRGSPGWTARTLDAQDYQQVVGLLTSFIAKSSLGKSEIGITAVLLDDITEPGRRVEVRAGSPMVDVVGRAADVVLWIAGRTAIDVALEGPPEAVAAVNGQHRGF